MAEKKVQVNTRMTEKQRLTLKKLADKKDLSVNRFVLERIFYSVNTITNDSTLVSLLESN